MRTTGDGGGKVSKPCLEKTIKKEENDEREIAAENSIVPLHFSEYYQIVPDVVFVSKKCIYLSLFFKKF